MSNLALRSLSSILFVLLILGPLFLSERIAFSVYALLGLFTVNELINLSNKCGSFANRIGSIAIYLILVLLVYQFSFEESIHLKRLLLGFLAVVLGSLILETFRSNRLPFESVATTIFAPIFVSLSFLGIVYFLHFRSDLPQPWIIVSVFGLIWINDSAAYLVGRKIGKRKLIERLSPGKTIEGSLAGLAFTLVASQLLAFIPNMPDWPYLLGFGIVSVFSGSIGDLLESRVKRAAGVKDSGFFLPGHGGFLDRFDAMMLAIPAAILYFEVFIPKT